MKSSTKKNVTLLGVGAALCLATAASLGAMSVGKASADELNSQKTSGETTVTYTAEDSWTVTIPNTINIASPSESDDKVVASDVQLEEGETLTVKVTSANEWHLRKAEEQSGGIEYELKADGGSALTNGGTVLTVESGTDTKEAKLTATLKDENVSTGGDECTDTLTFNVEVA